MTSDQSLRDVRKEQIELIFKAIESISKRFLNKKDRDIQNEVLKLELCNKTLKSSFLERRIQGIRDLNTLITSTSNTFTTDFLIDWMEKNDVFSTVWDARKTHPQILQRSNEIFKLLIKQDKLSE